MASPSPAPATVSSSRMPRCMAWGRCAGVMPGPSSSMVMSKWRCVSCGARVSCVFAVTCVVAGTVACVVVGSVACTVTWLRAHLQALSSRLPKSSCRSWVSPAKAMCGGSRCSCKFRCLSACICRMARMRALSAGASSVRCPGMPAAAAARERAMCQSTWRRASATCSATSWGSWESGSVAWALAWTLVWEAVWVVVWGLAW